MVFGGCWRNLKFRRRWFRPARVDRCKPARTYNDDVYRSVDIQRRVQILGCFPPNTKLGSSGLSVASSTILRCSSPPSNRVTSSTLAYSCRYIKRFLWNEIVHLNFRREKGSIVLYHFFFEYLEIWKWSWSLLVNWKFVRSMFVDNVKVNIMLKYKWIGMKEL